MSTDPRNPTRSTAMPDADDSAVSEDQLRARHDQQLADIEQLEAEMTALQEDPEVLQEDRDATRLLLESTRESLAATEHALARLAEGTYGSCVVCGQPIPPERLEAVPDATTCVACVAQV